MSLRCKRVHKKETRHNSNVFSFINRVGDITGLHLLQLLWHQLWWCNTGWERHQVQLYKIFGIRVMLLHPKFLYLFIKACILHGKKKKKKGWERCFGCCLCFPSFKSVLIHNKLKQISLSLVWFAHCGNQ